MSSIFTKILKGEIPGKIIYEDDLVFAIPDIFPKAKYHFLIIPKKEIKGVNDVHPEDEAILGRLFSVAKQLATDYGFADTGYRVVVNTNKDSGQEVFHIHMHLLGGEPLGEAVHTEKD